jgi:hypothetical protein
MQSLGKLGFTGVLLLGAGAWALVAATLPSLGAGGAGCAALQAVALAFAVVSWRPAHRDGHALAALWTSWMATIPGTLLLASVAARSDAPGAGELLVELNLLWLVVAPYLFATSVLTSPLRGAWRSLTLARVGHLGAWLASSFVTLSCWR